MKFALHPPSAVIGAAAAVVCLLATSLAFQHEEEAMPWEYSIVTDVEEDEAIALAEDGWEFAGYLGRSVQGASVDETLWKRPSH